jgi:hypothetical protein
VAEVVYNIAKQRIMQGLTDLDTTVIKAVAIITSKTGAADPDLATLAAIDAIGTVAFAAGTRPTLAGLSVAVDNVNDRAQANASAFSFPAEAVVALAMVIYDASTDTNDGTRIPICYYDTGFGAGVDLTSGGLNITLTNGWLRGT